MINVSSSITIYRPIKQVFDFISLSENDFQWQYGILASAQISDGVANAGTFFRSVGHLMGYRVQSTFEVTEYEQNKKYGFKSLSGPLHSNTLYTFDIDRGCTNIKVSTQASVINLIKVPESILEKQIKKQLKENLAMLKRILEAR